MTLLGSNSIKSDANTQIMKVTLIRQNLGFFTIKQGNVQLPGYFYFQEANQILNIFVSQKGSGIFNVADPFYAVFANTDNSIYFIGNMSGDDKQINLYLINSSGSLQAIQNSHIPCSSSEKAILFNVGINVYIVCQNKYQQSSNLFTIKFGNQAIAFVGTSTQLEDVGTIQSVQSFNGKVYIFHSSSGNNSSLSLKRILVCGSQLIQSQNISLKIFNFQGNYLNINIQSENFIQITTNNYLVGVSSITGEVLTQFQVPSINSFYLHSVIPFQSTSLFNYVQITDSSSFMQSQVLFQQPKLLFTQTDIQQQQYTLTFTNKLISQSLQVISDSLALDLTGYSSVSILKNLFYENLIVYQDKGISQSFNIEDSVIGSNLDIAQNINNSFKELTINGDIQSLSLLNQTNFFSPQQNTTSASLRNLQSQTKNIVSIHSTQSDIILIQSLTQDEKVSMSLVKVESSLLNSTSNLQVLQETILPNQYISIDNSGFFSYVDNNQNYAIKVFAQQTGQNSYQFYDVPLQCQYSDNSNFYFTADIINGLIIVFCKDQITVMSFFVQQSSIVTQVTSSTPLNGQISYPISQQLVSNGILYFTDSSNNIYSFDCVFGQIQQKIQVQIPQNQQFQEIILYSNSFLLVTKDSTDKIQVNQYNYQIASNGNNAIFLRQINLSGLENISKMKALRQLINPEEYLIVQSQDLQTVNIFRLNNISAQNQLYKAFKFPFQFSNFDQLYFAEKTIGLLDSNQNFISYWINEFTILQVDVQVNNEQQFLQTFEYSVTNSLTINSNNNFSINYLIQKDVSSKNAEIIVNQNNENQISLIKNSFQNQNIVSEGSTVRINTRGIVPSNLLGWEIFSNNGNVTAQITQNLQITNNEGQKVSDQIQLMDNFYAQTVGNSVYIGNQLYASFNNTIQNCFLYIDESTINTETTQQAIQTTLTFNVVCYDYTINQILLDKVQFTGTQDIQTQQLTFKSTNGTYTGSFDQFFALKSLQITKVYTDSQLGSVMLIKDSTNFGLLQLCKYTANSSSLKLVIDCNYDASSQQINGLSLINSIWIQAIKNYIYISANGNIYLNLVDNMQVVNILSTISQIDIYQKCNVLTAQLSQPNAFFLSLSNQEVFEIGVSSSSDQSVAFNLELSNIFKGEEGLIFTGYGALQAQGNYILFMLSASDQSQLFAVSYQPYSSSLSTIYIIQSSAQLIYDQESAINVIKIFKSNQVFSFLTLSSAGSSSTIKYLQYNELNNLSIKCKNPPSQSINGPGAYLQILNSEFSSQTTIPINVSVTAETSSGESLQFLKISICAILILLM
ncbi:hypothetical protein ABPG73_006459 [Tetrahymena malaccensis]